MALNRQPVAIGSRSFDILVALVERRGEVVPKEDLVARAWPNVRVEEHNLKVHVSALRRALGNDGRKFLITIPGRGYTFVAPVSLVQRLAVEDYPSTTELPPEQPSPAVSQVGPSSFATMRPAIKIGILHSLTGPMAQSEGPIVDASLLAIEEINRAGGVLRRSVEPIVVDCESDEFRFGHQAEHLIVNEKVCSLFGCLTSASRKQVKAVVERYDHLLMYPMQYEGLEQSSNIFYLGAAPNQQVLPAARWAFAFLGRKRFFLIGWDSVYSRAANAILRDEIRSLGGQVVGEEYIHVAGVEISGAVRQVTESRAEIILNSIVGDINAVFCRALRSTGIRAPDVPTIYFSASENELKGITATDSVGDYAAFSYFQCLDRPENRAFVTSFRSRYGPHRVMSDPMEAGYFGVRMWANAVTAAGSEDVRAIRRALPGQSFNAPGGPVTIDPENQHTWKTVRIAEIMGDGQFSVIWSSEKPIRPVPYPASRSVAKWDEFLAALHKRWQGHWGRPSPL